VRSFESEALINARSATVWEVITDAGNLAVWESGITGIEGDLSDGGVIWIKTARGNDRITRTRVRQVPGEVMIWTAGIPFGLLTLTRTFTLAEDGASTRFRIREEASGPLCRFSWGLVSGSDQELDDFVEAVRKRSELLDRTTRHLNTQTTPQRADGGSAPAPESDPLLTPRPAGSTLYRMEEETEDHLIRSVVDRLAARYPQAPRAHVENVVAHEYESLSGGRIRTYVPILVEHSARDRLHHEVARRPEL
jgi:hypothetical protein